MFASPQAEIAQLFSYYNLLLLAQGLAATFVLSAIGCLAGFSVGFVVAVIRVTRARAAAPLRWIAFAYCFLFRRVPFLVTLMLVFYASQSSGAKLSTFAVALVSVCLIASAYLGEIIRSGLESVHKNQWDAALTLNFSFFETLRFVIVPQAWRVVVPPTFGFFVMFIKDTALASQIGVVELTQAAKTLSSRGYSPELVYGTILILYFAVSFPLARAGQWLEARHGAARHR